MLEHGVQYKKTQTSLEFRGGGQWRISCQCPATLANLEIVFLPNDAAVLVKGELALFLAGHGGSLLHQGIWKAEAGGV